MKHTAILTGRNSTSDPLKNDKTPASAAIIMDSVCKGWWLKREEGTMSAEQSNVDATYCDVLDV